LGKVIDLDYIECVSFVRLDGEFVEVE
jgi:hypothetical protein